MRVAPAGRLDVGLGDAPAARAAGDRAEIDAERLGRAPGHRGGVGLPVRGGRRRGGCRRVAGPVLRGRSGRARAGGHPREHLADRDGVAGRGEDLGQRAGSGGGDLGVDLVGGDLDDRLVRGERVALALEPFEDDALGDRLAHLRHRDLDHATGGAVAVTVLRGGGRGRLARGGRRRRGAVAGGRPGGGDLGQQRADRDRVALGRVDLGDRAGGGRRDLGVDLVGGDLDDRLVGRDLLALAL